MREDLVDIRELMDLLGYTDERSVKKWCSKRNIAILTLGLNKFVSKHLLTHYIDNQIVIFDKDTFDQEKLPEMRVPPNLATMNYTTNLTLPSDKRPDGLYLFCNGCKSYYTSHKDAKCKCRRLVYKARIHVSGTKHGVIPKVLHASDFTDAVIKFHAFKKNLEANSFQQVPIKKVEKIPVLLDECFRSYIDFLNNIGVPEHKQKKRDPDHIRKVGYAFELYAQALKENGINTSILKFTDVNDQMVGFVHKLLLTEMDSANKTYNNRMALLRTFTSHIIKEYYKDYNNPFLGAVNLLVTKEVTSVQEDEFNALMGIITPESGVEKRVQKGRVNLRTTTWYKPWLKNGIRIGIFTGGRSEDLVELKWSDIQVDKKGNLHTIKSIDYKIDNANNHKIGNREHYYKYFPITAELRSELMDIGYEIYKDTDKYIIAPEETMKRSTVARFLSGAFTHYYRQLNTGRSVTFKTLRKTYHTSALIQYGAASTALTNHTTISITDKNYFDKEVTREDAKGSFSVFKPKKNRKKN